MLTYVKGDATFPIGEGKKLIIHCCNNRGGWGAGFVLALNKRWHKPKQAYLDMKDRSLGHVEIVPVESDVAVANIIGQDGYGRDGRQYVSYDALRTAFKALAAKLDPTKHTIHGPRLGAGLAGGNWTVIEEILITEFVHKGFNVTIYDLN